MKASSHQQGSSSPIYINTKVLVWKCSAIGGLGCEACPLRVTNVLFVHRTPLDLQVFIKAFTAFIKGFTACREIEEWDLPCLRSYRSGSCNSGAVSSSTHHSKNTQGGTEAEHERSSDRRLHCSTKFPKRRGKTNALQEITANGTNTVNDKSPVYCGWPQTRDARSLSHAFLSAVAAGAPPFAAPCNALWGYSSSRLHLPGTSSFEDEIWHLPGSNYY